jgi:putative lysine transport system substrate-binding protein
MNQIIRISAITLSGALLLAGCGSSSTASASAAATAASSASADSGKQTLRVGMECNYAPFNWSSTTKSDTAQPISDVDYCDGYDVVMAETLADKMGYDVQIVKLDWDNLILSLQNNQIDAIIAGMTDTPDREKEIDFTTPYYVSEEVVIVRADSDLTSITDIQQLSGYKVQGQMNTIYDEVIDQIQGVDHQPAAETFPASIQALQAGGVDAVVSELPVANGVVAANPDLAIVRFEEGHGFEADSSVSIGVSKDNTDLKDKLQSALDTISEDERQQMMQDAVDRQPATEE